MCSTSASPRGIRPVALLLVALLVLSASACHNYYQSGLDALRGGNMAQAEEEAREGLKDKPGDPWLHLLMAEVFITQEKFTDARFFADVAVQRLPKEARPKLALGEAQIKLGNLPAGLEQWVAARAIDPQLARTYEEEMRKLLPRAIAIALDTDKPEIAVVLIEGLKELKPDHPDAGGAKLRTAR